MNDQLTSRLQDRAAAASFDQSSSSGVWDLLGTLAAAKPGGRFLELGTGVGIGTAAILSGMTESAHLVTVELDQSLSLVAQAEIADPRIDWVVADGGIWLAEQDPMTSRYDLIFADTWPGKFTHQSEALALVAPGGFYVIDDLLPQLTWPPDHEAKVDQLVSRLTSASDFRTCRLDTASGIMICTRIAD